LRPRAPAPPSYSMDPNLPPRTLEVLFSIVHNYIETGEPVASRTIARARKDHLSPATVRNIMADLADLGYLDQPHTSAGRVPTAKAFRLYVRSLSNARPLSGVEGLREELHQTQSPEQRAELVSHVLTTLTRNVGIVASVPTASQILHQIELVPLPDARVLMVVVLRDGVIRNQVAHLAHPVGSDELASLRNYVNTEFGGWALPDIRIELRRRLQEDRAAYDGLLQNLAKLSTQGLLDVGLAPFVVLEGASNLFSTSLPLTETRLRELFRTLEEKQRLLELLDQFLAHAPGEIQVQVGLEDLNPALGDLSLIGISIPLSTGLETRMAVLGPMRMNYNRVVAAVAHVGSALKGLPPQ